VLLVEVAIVRTGTRWPCDQAFALVEPDGLHRGPGSVRQLPNLHAYSTVRIKLDSTPATGFSMSA
jgi:hypothetical protein